MGDHRHGNLVTGKGNCRIPAFAAADGGEVPNQRTGRRGLWAAGARKTGRRGAGDRGTGLQLLQLQGEEPALQRNDDARGHIAGGLRERLREVRERWGLPPSSFGRGAIREERPWIYESENTCSASPEHRLGLCFFPFVFLFSLPVPAALPPPLSS